ncbi:MAG: translocation/assembly module TamB domain-containing protein [Cyanobacteria bacterium]|nr:translocation/assembly module TamB domain-containing protein [Cyanobacteriota bacterium]MDA1247170.1 translocation/assembly module TamB domain-containing protein [Cyanobacteriota bacterium]
MLGATAGGCGALILLVWAGDQALRKLYLQWKPRLEQPLSELFGQPVELGKYQGLGWGGVRLGPSRISPGRLDGSTVLVRSVLVSLDPLASLSKRLPVMHVGLAGARVELRRNSQGQYWVLGTSNAEPPRLDLRLRLVDPAELHLLPFGTSLRLTGNGALRPHLQEMEVSAWLRSDTTPGSLAMRLQGNWQSQRWDGSLRAKALQLAPLQRLLAVPGQLSGRADGTLALAWRDRQPLCRGAVQLRQFRWLPATDLSRLELPFSELRCSGKDLELDRSVWRWGAPGGKDLQGTVRFKGLWQQNLLLLRQFELTRGSSWLRLKGSLANRFDLSGQWLLRPSDLPLQIGTPGWVLNQQVGGSVTVRGPRNLPQIQTRFGQSSNPLLGRWDALLDWSDQRLVLRRFSSAHLLARGILPLSLRAGEGLVPGQLELSLEMQRYPLERLDLLVGAQLQGILQASGRVRGPLHALTPDLNLRIDQPGAGPLSSRESWQGQWLGDPVGGGRLRMQALAPAPVGMLTARLDSRWVPLQVRLERAGGTLELNGRPRGYRWQAFQIPLEGMQLALGPKSRRRPLQALLSGQGLLELQPLAFSGRAQLDRPVFLGVWGKSLQANFRYANRRYSAQGNLSPLSGGTLAVNWSGVWHGAFRARLQSERLPPLFLQQLVRAWPLWRGEGAPILGRASDIGSLLIDTFSASVQDQLRALALARARLSADRLERERQSKPQQRMQQLAGHIDSDLRLYGPNLLEARVELQARAHLWLPEANQDQPLTDVPVLLKFTGPLRRGAGNFNLADLPLELLALLTPVPVGLRGRLSLQGSYRLGTPQPELALSISLVDTFLRQTALVLERGTIQLEQDRLLLDISLRAAGAASSVELAGVVPLDSGQQGLELRLASRDDGLRFLAGLAQPTLQWNQGSGDLQLLVRGSVREPIANGFLRFRGAQLQFIGQKVRDVDATVLFDFEQLLLQEFNAKVGDKGVVRGKGSLGLFRPEATADGKDATLKVELEKVPFATPRIKAVADGSLQVGGSLTALDIGGELAVAQGSVNVQPARLASEANLAAPVASAAELLESRWDYGQPLVLLGPDVESNASEALRTAVPNASFVGFDELKLKLGPDLKVVIPNLVSFGTSGLLRLNGRLDESLRLQGVVRLLNGRLNIFTTTFGLDPDSPNVAVFTPSMGLIPFLDVSLRTRVSDNLQTTSGVATAGSQSLQDFQVVGATNSLDQLNLIRVFLSVSGPADRLADDLILRSSPPLTGDRLLALIGGNTLAGLNGSAGSTALATALGQVLLSPLLGTLGDAFGQRLSFALYPTYVNQSGAQRRSGRVPSQLVLGTEIGLDLTERFNASVLAAPNRSDLPSQLNLNFKASELLNLQGSINSLGAWQTQLQLFFRF